MLIGWLLKITGTASIVFQSNSLMIDFSLKASIQIIKTKVQIACLNVHPVSLQINSRFLTEIENPTNPIHVGKTPREQVKFWIR